MMSGKPRVLVVGSGAIGGVISTLMAHSNIADVHVISRNQTVAETLRSNGLSTVGVGEHITAHATVHTAPPNETFDFILLATQPPAVEVAAQSVLNCLADGGRMVVLQNGLCEQRVAAICGESRTIGGIVAFGASTDNPGVFERTSQGGFVIGRIDGAQDPQLDALQRILMAVGPVTQTDNLLGARFSKLAINCAVSGLGTVAGTALGTMLNDRKARNIALAVMREAVAVSRAEGIALESLSGTFNLNWVADPNASNRGPSHWVRHALLLSVGFKYRKLRSSMLRAIEQGRPPAVDFINGEIASRGRALNIATPINETVTNLIHQIARGEQTASPDLLRTVQ